MLYLCLGHCWLRYQCKSVENYAKKHDKFTILAFFRTVSSYIAFQLEQKFKAGIKKCNLGGRGTL